MVITTRTGAWSVGRGVIDLFRGVVGARAHRGWTLVLCLVSLVAGVFVLVHPQLSLYSFVVLAGIWMIVYGALVAGAALVMRRASA